MLCSYRGDTEVHWSNWPPSANVFALKRNRTTGYESYKYKITKVSHNHKNNSHKITIIYKNSQKITKKLQKFCNLL